MNAKRIDLGSVSVATKSSVPTLPVKERDLINNQCKNTFQNTTYSPPCT